MQFMRVVLCGLAPLVSVPGDLFGAVTSVPGAPGLKQIDPGKGPRDLDFRVLLAVSFRTRWLLAQTDEI